MKKINTLALTAVLAVGLIFPMNALSMPTGGDMIRPGGVARSNQCTAQTQNALSSNALSSNALSSNLLAQIFSVLQQQLVITLAESHAYTSSVCGDTTNARTGIRAFY